MIGPPLVVEALDVGVVGVTIGVLVDGDGTIATLGVVSPYGSIGRIWPGGPANEPTGGLDGPYGSIGRISPEGPTGSALERGAVGLGAGNASALELDNCDSAGALAFAGFARCGATIQRPTA